MTRHLDPRMLESWKRTQEVGKFSRAPRMLPTNQVMFMILEELLYCKDSRVGW